ncbi:taurine catabolism dioxygenase [Chlorella sorokiniana]|uniref:Taurine catabolism dioxygenase n=1 Tax=Chlorella sorokiniana TaxID=3076 RepID=A0A2P6TXM7_CHLSO|nr:taurine catabolism dioxygenase [Chlorella sorokiniana]|eukprot:PRW58816.1 taurine catabolism dioxygenase [Chlorella sorokiniana]
MAVGESLVQPAAKPAQASGELGKPITTAAAWTATSALAEKEQWILELSPQQVEEILEATTHATSTGKPVQEVTRADFPLPTLAPILESIRQSVLFGRGFQLIRAGWRMHPQVGHVKNLTGNNNTFGVRVYLTSAAQPWHVDASDIVSLLCLKTARSGGRSGWASGVSIYNRVLAERPDLLEELTKPVPYTRYGEVNKGEKPYYEQPVFNFYQGHFQISVNDLVAGQSQQLPGIPRISDKQLEAIKYVASLAADPELHLEWDLQPGDIQLLNNWTNLHNRTEIDDHEDINDRRHLLRIWRVSDDGQPLDPAYHNATNPIGRRGIVLEGQQDTVPLEAE